MKKFFTFLALTCVLVPAIHGMESVSESKNLKRSCDAVDLTNDTIAPLVTKKQKTEENIVSNGLAKKIVYGKPVAKQTMLNFGQTQSPRVVNNLESKSTNAKKSNNNSFECLECGKAFPTKKSLASHKGGHTGMKRANRILQDKSSKMRF